MGKKLNSKDKSKIRYISIFIIIIILFSFGIYNYINKPNISGSAIETVVINNDKQQISIINTDEFSNSVEVHWDHMPLTYSMNDACKTRMNGAFEKDIGDAVDFIEDRTDEVITFEESEDEVSDIYFDCTQPEVLPGLTIAEAYNNYNLDNNTYSNATVRIYKPYDCMGERPVITAHEILHTLGLDHRTDYPYTWDIMNVYYNPAGSESDHCEKEIDPRDIEYLKGIYG